MDILKKIFNRDNFFFGALLGFIIPAIAFILIRFIVSLSGNTTFLMRMPGEDPMQVFAIMFNLIPFRIYMVNRHMDNTGRGLLFSTFILVLLYFIVYAQTHSLL